MAKVGRPLKFQDLDELQKSIDEYFANTPTEEVTITGLAMHLDTFRNVLWDIERNEERPEFSNTIKKAKQRVEHAYEKRNIKRGNAGDIFALKNFGRTDKQEIKNTHDVDDNLKDFIDKVRSGDVD